MKKINILDVAKAAGVSTTTVSRVINKVPTVKEYNRRKVEEAIAKLGFHPNISAQRLAGGANNTIGLVLPRFEDMFHSFYVSEILKGVGSGTERFNLDLLLHITDGRSFINISSVGGILFADIDQNEEQVNYILQEKIPCVVMNHYLKELPLNCVAIDNKTAAKNVVKYLLALGHQNIATITGHLRTQVGLDRLGGYLEALREAGLKQLDGYVQYGDYYRKSATLPAKQLLSLKERPTAIFAASDEMALEVIEVARGLNIKVPQDLSVVGFDDSPLASNAPVPLTTVRQPLSEIGAKSVEILYQQLNSEKTITTKLLLPTQLVERESCRKIA
jgi:DNA-binding LacI/PurR family transcriptional regulator